MYDAEIIGLSSRGAQCATAKRNQSREKKKLTKSQRRTVNHGLCEAQGSLCGGGNLPSAKEGIDKGSLDCAGVKLRREKLLVEVVVRFSGF